MLISTQNFTVIGTYKSVVMGSSGNLALASGTTYNCCSISLEAGTWVVTSSIAYQSGGTTAAYRCLYLSNSAGSNYLAIQSPGVAVGNTVLNGTRTLVCATTTTVILRALQGSGATLNVPNAAAWIQAVRIK